MARLTRLTRPPRTESPELNSWLRELHGAINDLPAFSISSTTNGPESNTTADEGTLLIDVGSATTTSWIKQTGSGSTGWVELDNYLWWEGAVSYAGMHEEEDLPEIILNSSGYSTLNRFNHQSLEYGDLSSDTVNGVVTAASTMTVKVAFQSSFTGAANTLMYAYIHKNGIKVDFGTHQKTLATGEGSFSIAPSTLTVESGDTIAIGMRASGDNKAFTNTDGQFEVWKLQ